MTSKTAQTVILIHSNSGYDTRHSEVFCGPLQIL